jgi:tetratricopeptide (TPR) repeat protein
MRYGSTLLMTSCISALALALAGPDLAAAESAAPSLDERASVSTPDQLRASQRSAFKRHIRRAEAYYHSMDFARSITEYEEAYRIARDPNILYQLGRAYHRDGKWSEALAYYEKYQREVPDADPQLKRVLDEYIRQLHAALRGAQTLQGQSDPQTANAEAQPAALSRLTLVPASPTLVGSSLKAPGIGKSSEPEKAKPIYIRGWFWGVIGGTAAAAVAGGVAGGLATRSSGPSLPPGAQVRSIQPTLFTISGVFP